ncbi:MULTISPECIES: methylmalonyl Co-A mutase-associated GTPase MeaB [Dietzia]|uniref:methylmalonyl Co-A mutase-associated GTPase MeaB n=1 Tax=Dietzia TaxID=37914 RepID=UPI0001F643DC|nr:MULTISPECIES: methylmalonyl Co-A mutase-associated GTPase MeaB [Dietzia]EFV92158.1 membrane ATPase/protein kinase [Dietzia cinnamea P4]
MSTTAGTGAPRGPVPRSTGPRPRREIDVDALLEGVLEDRRPVLARAITLLESTNPAHREKAQQLLLGALPHAGGALRIGITGVPGVGKSTFIESLGLYLVEQGHKVAVLAVDPSSTRTGGSILGDKTRMATLSTEPRAYIRPSPTSGTLGGVAKATRETMVLLEAAGFDVILVETVGVGQSEVTVAGMVDCFTFLTLARTGDQLQGIKKGVLELADVVAVNKADGPHVKDAQRAARELGAALRLVRPADAVWKVPVLTMSGLEGEGLEGFWDAVRKHQQTMAEIGEVEARRARQQVDWTWSMVHETLMARLAADPDVKRVAPEVEQQVRDGTLTAALAAQAIIDAFDS